MECVYTFGGFLLISIIIAIWVALTPTKYYSVIDGKVIEEKNEKNI